MRRRQRPHAAAVTLRPAAALLLLIAIPALGATLRSGATSTPTVLRPVAAHAADSGWLSGAPGLPQLPQLRIGGLLAFQPLPGPPPPWARSSESWCAREGARMRVSRICGRVRRAALLHLDAARCGIVSAYATAVPPPAGRSSRFPVLSSQTSCIGREGQMSWIPFSASA